MWTNQSISPSSTSFDGPAAPLGGGSSSSSSSSSSFMYNPSCSKGFPCSLIPPNPSSIYPGFSFLWNKIVMLEREWQNNIHVSPFTSMIYILSHLVSTTDRLVLQNLFDRVYSLLQFTFHDLLEFSFLQKLALVFLLHLILLMSIVLSNDNW